jgi:enterochelin esterase-like enzyme
MVVSSRSPTVGRRHIVTANGGSEMPSRTNDDGRPRYWRDPLLVGVVAVTLAIVLLIVVVRGSEDGAAASSRRPSPAVRHRHAVAARHALASRQAGLAPPSLVPGIPPTGRVARGVRRFPPPATPPGVPPGTVDTLGFYSPALHRRDDALVYLPPGYRREAARGRRYPVLYVLHGSPGIASSVFNGGWAGRDASVLLAQHRIRPMIIVAPDGRYGLRNQTEWANGRHGRYLSYVRDVVRAVDQQLATIPRRADRVIAGDSEGAYGATNVALHDLGLFGGFQSWAGYFTETPKGTFAGASLSTIAANSPLDYVPSLAHRIRHLGLHAFLYVGAQDRQGLLQLAPFAPELRAAGVRVGTAIYPGRHDWALWRAEMPHMLELASSWFSKA